MFTIIFKYCILYFSSIFNASSFKTELDRELKILIDVLIVEMKNDTDKNQGKVIHIQEETLIKVKNYFQEMVCYNIV